MHNNQQCITDKENSILKIDSYIKSTHKAVLCKIHFPVFSVFKDFTCSNCPTVKIMTPLRRKILIPHRLISVPTTLYYVHNIFYHLKIFLCFPDFVKNVSILEYGGYLKKE